MESIKLTARVGKEGLLYVQLPTSLTECEVEVMVIYQPLEKQSKRPWSPGFFERTFGAWQGDPLVRELQGELPEREPFA